MSSEQAETQGTDITTTQPKKPNFHLAESGQVAIKDSSDLYRLASTLVSTGMVPKAYQGNANAAYAAMITGAELGLSPAASLRCIAVIEGTPSIWGAGGYTLPMRHASYDRHEITWQEPGQPETDVEPELDSDLSKIPDGVRCICRAYRKGSDRPFIAKFSVGDAKRAGLWGATSRTGAAMPWSKYPTRMMMHKAVGNALEAAIPEAYLGMFKAGLGDEDTYEETAPEKPTLPANGTTRLRQPKTPPAKKEDVTVKVTIETAPAPETAAPAAYDKIVDAEYTVTPDAQPAQEQPQAPEEQKTEAEPAKKLNTKELMKEFRESNPTHTRAGMTTKDKKNYVRCDCGAKWELNIVAGVITFPILEKGDGSCDKPAEEAAPAEAKPKLGAPPEQDELDKIAALPAEQLNQFFEETLKAAAKNNLADRRKKVSLIGGMIRRRLVLAESPIHIQQTIQWMTRSNFLLSMDGELQAKIKEEVNAKAQTFQK